MAYAKERREKGQPTGRWTAVYLLPGGKEKSAGTYDDQATAERVAQEQEEFARQGRKGVSPEDKATMILDDYFPKYLADLPVELSTKTGYRNVYRAYVKEKFGQVRVADLTREAVRAHLADLRARGLKPTTQKAARTCISGIMRVAVEDGYRTENPVLKLGVQKRRGGSRKIKVLTTDQFEDIFNELPSDGARILARVIIGTGCRPSEALALGPDDIDYDNNTIEFNKSIQKVGKEDSPTGKATLMIGPIKTGDVRTLKVDRGLILALRRWVRRHAVTDLLFPRDLTLPRQRATSVRADKVTLTPELVATLGTKTAPNGREYQHGTWHCYITAKCRDCVYCRQAFADYRFELEQRNNTKGHSYGSKAPTTTAAQQRLIDPVMWRTRFQRACKAAGLPFIPTAYQLRHTHASWLIANGEDPKTVMTRLGHTSLATTNVYVQQVDDGQSSADIMASLGIDWGDGDEEDEEE